MRMTLSEYFLTTTQRSRSRRGIRVIVFSISPSSIRSPRIFTW